MSILTLNRRIFILVFSFFILINFTHSQVIGDYRSIASGNWETLTSWETYNGTVWIGAVDVPESGAGVISIRSGHTITNMDFILIDQVVVDAGGILNLSADASIVNGAGVDLQINGTVNLSGIVNGSASTTVEVVGILNWTDNLLTFNTTVKPTGVISATSNTTKTLKRILTIEIGGNVNLNYDGTLSFSGATINNAGTITNGGDINFSDGGGSNVFNNNTGGSFTKSSSTGTSRIGVALTNVGSITIASGTLETTSTVTNTGTITINPNTTLDASAGVFTHNSGTFTVNGTLKSSTGATFNQNGPITFGVSSKLNAGGTYNLNADQTWNLMEITVDGNLNILTTRIVNWTTGNIVFNGGTFTNNGIFNIQFDGNMLDNGGGIVINNGIFSKSAGATISEIALNFTNNGDVIINSGTLELTKDLLNAAFKLIDVKPGATLKTSGSGTVTGNGPINVTSGSLVSANTFIQNIVITFAGNCSFTVNGTHTINANQTFGPGMTVAVNGGTLINSATYTMTWSGGTIGFASGVFNNNGIINNTFGGLMVNTSGANVLNNNATGVFNKTIGSTTVQVPFANTGEVNVNSGTLVTNTFTHDGVMNVAGSTLESNGAFAQNQVINFTSNPTFIVRNNHSLNTSQTYDNVTMNIIAGKLINTASRTLTWNSGVITISNSGQLENSGTFNNTFNGTINAGSGSGSFSNISIFQKSAGGGTTTINVPFTNSAGATIEGNNVLDFTAASSFAGTISPGLSPGNLTINGTTNPLNGSTTLNMEIVSLSDFDVLQRAGSLALGGTLSVTGSMGYGTISIITAGSISGSFGTVNLPGAEYSAVVTPTSVDIIRAVLPVELSAFSGIARDQVNLLKWTAESELNFEKYILERASEISEELFTSIAEINGTGSFSSRASYEYLDEQPMQLSYYRLKMIDTDGSYKFSKIIALQNENAEFGEVKAFPVPTVDITQIQFTASDVMEYRFILTDINGRILNNEIFETAKGLNQESIDLSIYPSGVYYLSIIGGQVNKNVKLIKK